MLLSNSETAHFERVGDIGCTNGESALLMAPQKDRRTPMIYGEPMNGTSRPSAILIEILCSNYKRERSKRSSGL